MLTRHVTVFWFCHFYMVLTIQCSFLTQHLGGVKAKEEKSTLRFYVRLHRYLGGSLGRKCAFLLGVPLET